ncbi:MAG: hypothetical protein V2A63_00480 [Patescibacteria group bacterium]
MARKKADQPETEQHGWSAISGFSSPDSKNRIVIPSSEVSKFCSSNQIEQPKELVVVPNDTLDGMWGMTNEMFAKLAAAIRAENRDLVKFIYQVRFCFGLDQKQRRFGPLTPFSELGLVDFKNNERLQIACSAHQDYQDGGYFLRFALARMEDGKIKFLNFRRRLAEVFGDDFLSGLDKMRR